MMAYDMSNIFARILREELPCKKYHDKSSFLYIKG